MSKRRTNKGKELESLVAFIEGLHLPDGFNKETNKRIRTKGKGEEAEFDIVISGTVGSAKLVWLIECRDRPSAGAAPVSWIEQLVGRRSRFQINKITAVSTQPFSMPAKNFAGQEGIDLREVKSLSASEFEDWLQMPSYQQITRYADLKNASLLLPENIEDELGFAAGRKLSENSESSLLRSLKNGSAVHPKDAFLGVVEQFDLFDGLLPNGPTKTVNLHVKYANPEDRFVIDTEHGTAPVDTIIFHGELFIKEISVPLESVFEYHNVDTGAAISQTATYESQPVANNHWALRLHKDAVTGETQVMLVATQPPGT